MNRAFDKYDSFWYCAALDLDKPKRRGGRKMPDKDFVGVNPGLIRPMTCDEQAKRGWTVEVSGKIVPDLSHVRLFNERMGVELQYGWRIEGYDGVVIHEPAGGGSVLVPYVIYDVPSAALNYSLDREILWVGLLDQERKTQGGRVLNLPRGFLNPGETHFETAVREFKEETGHTAKTNRITDLCSWYSARGNANSAFFDTSRLLRDGRPEGAQYYAVEFHPDEVYVTKLHPDDPPVLAFKKDVVRPAGNSPTAERIFSCYFYPWDVAAGIADQFTSAGISRLLSYLVTRSHKMNLLAKKVAEQRLFPK